MAHSTAASASAVFIQADGVEGQGYAFKLGQLCLAFTANHVVANAKRVELVSAKGESVVGTVIGRDAALDLALLQLPAERGRPLPKLCAGETSMPLDVPLWISRAGPRSQLGLQRVPSRGGSVDHVQVQAGNLDGASPYFHIKAASANAIAQGDSGATVWIHSTAPKQDVESNGTLIGIAIAVENGLVRVLRADFLQQAVFSMLWPIDESKLTLAIGQQSQYRMNYGAAPRALESARPESMAWSAGAATVHFVIDLGERDTTVRGISVSRGALNKIFGDLLKSLVAQASTQSDLLRIGVKTSQKRPFEGGAWVNERCMKQDPRALMNPCEFQGTKVVRGMIVELSGDISRISTLRLYLSR